MAFYGPDDKIASNLAIGIVRAENAEAEALQRWYAKEGDVRRGSTIGEEMLAFIRDHDAKTVVTTDSIVFRRQRW